jgi:hypothetical protein
MSTFITLNPIDPGTDTRVTVRLCASQDAAHTGAAGQVWWPAIVTQPVIQARLFDGDFTAGVDAGSATVEVRLDVLRTSGQFPRVERYDWAGATATIQRLVSGSLVDLAVMKVDSFASEDMQLGLRLSASLELFDADVLTATYAGTTGIEGGADLKGQVKPWVFGRASNVEPVFIDQIENVFQVSGYGPVQAISAVYERGASFGASVGNFANYAALVAANIPDGRWGTCLAQGLIRLGAPPAGVITCDVDGDSTGGFLRRTGAILTEIANRLGLSASINATSFAALDTAVPRNVNIVIREQTSFMQLVQRMVAPCNAVPGIGQSGRLLVSRVVFGSEQFTLDAQGREMPPVLGMARQNTSSPYKRIQMGAQRSWRVHSFDEIAFFSDLIDRGLYVAATVYREGDIVASADKSRWLYISTTPASGNAPPTWPTASNAFWSNLEPPLAPAAIGLEAGATRNVPRGTYAAGTTYVLGDSVIFSGSSYQLIVASSTGNAPPDVARWALLANAGSGPAGADGLPGLTVIVSNEAHVVATAADGSGGDYTGAGGQMRILRGTDVLTPTFSIAAKTPNTSWISIDSSGNYTVTDPGVDLATATLRAVNVGVNYDRTYTLARSKAGAPGTAGTNGLTNASVFIYRRSATTPALPTTTSTYTFVTGDITGLDNGWTRSVPSGTLPLYVAVAVASSGGTTDTIAAGEWSSPVVLAQDGAAGLNSASVFLYRRSASAPPVPSVTSTYTFATGVLTGQNNSWQQSVPSGADPVWIITASAAATSATDTIATGEWSSPAILAENGAQGPVGPRLALVTDNQAFTFTDGAANPGSQTITLTALLNNLSGTATWSTSPSVTLGGSGNTRTVTVADFGANRQVTVEATLGGITDKITLVRVDRDAFGGNANRVPFTRFEGGRGWAAGGAPSGGQPFLSTFEDQAYIVAQPVFSAVGQAHVLYTNPGFPVVPGERLSVSAFAQAFSINPDPQPATWVFYIEYRDATNGNLGLTFIGSGSGLLSQQLSGFTPPVPANARRAFIVLLAQPSGAGTVQMALREPMVTSAATGQTTHPAYVPGPNASDGADPNNIITIDGGGVINGIGTAGIKVNNALLPLGNSNRVPFTRFEGGRGWGVLQSTFASVSSVFSATDDGLIFVAVDATASAVDQNVFFGNNPRFPVIPNERLSVSSTFRISAESGPAPNFWRFDIEWFNGAGSSLGISEIATGSGAAVNLFRAAFVTAPSTAQSARLSLRAESAGAGILTLRIASPMVTSAATGQTTHPPFTPGPNASDGADPNGLITIDGNGVINGIGTASIPVNNNLLPLGNVNRLPFTRFEGARGWVAVGNFSPTPFLILFNGRYFICAEPTFTAADQNVYLVSAPRIPVIPGERLSVSSRIQAFALPGGLNPDYWALYIEYYDTLFGVTQTGSTLLAQGFSGVNESTLHAAFSTVPAGSQVAQLVLRYQSDGAGPVRMAILEPMVTSATTGQTVHPPYAPGPNSDDGADVTAEAQRSIEPQFPSIEIKQGEAGHTGNRTVTHVAKRGTVTLSGGTWSLPSVNLGAGSASISSSTGTVTLSGIVQSGAYAVRYTHTDSLATDLAVNVTYIPTPPSAVVSAKTGYTTSSTGVDNTSAWTNVITLTLTGCPAGVLSFNTINGFAGNEIAVSSGTGTCDHEARLKINGTVVANSASQNTMSGGVVSFIDFSDLFAAAHLVSSGTVTVAVELRRTDGTGTLDVMTNSLDCTVVAT